jgi:hypothetical protein
MHHPTLFALLLATASACVTAPDDELLDDTEAELSAFDWSGSSTVAFSTYAAEVATLGTTTYMVSTWQSSNELVWRKRNSDGTWTNARMMDGKRTKDAPALAAFNGYLYAVYLNENDPTQLLYARFDPATETWTTSIPLPYSTKGTVPALAAFDNRLFFVGTDAQDLGLSAIWVGTMDANEVFGDLLGITRRFSASQPSLAVFANKLYMASRNAVTNRIEYSTHNPGTAANAWSPTALIPAGPSSCWIVGDEYSIAAVNGYLHLVHRRLNGTAVYWTYFDRCKWALELAIDTSTITPSTGTRRLSLTAIPNGLVLARGEHPNGYMTYAQKYNAPPTPERLPQCLGAM